MYIVKNGNSFTLSDSCENAIIRVSAPMFEENGKEFTLSNI